MKRLGYYVTALILLAVSVNAQSGWKGRGHGGWGSGSAYNKMYDVSSVETIAGKITAIDTLTPFRGMSAGIHAMVKTDKETISVHLGPAWFLENQEMDLAVNDAIEIKGSRVVFNKEPVIIAAELKKNNSVLKLRDDQGLPVWNGWRQVKR